MPKSPSFRRLAARPGAVYFRPEARLPRFSGSPGDPAKSLAALYLAVIGLGSVGLNLALHATRLGVRGLLLCDQRSFKPESLITHPLHPAAVGKRKAVYAAQLCLAINPALKLMVWDGPVQDLPLDGFIEADAVLMATDNLAAEAATGQLCLHFQKPLIHCSLHGETLTAHAKLLDLSRPGAPCPVCFFGETEMQQLAAETQFSCEGAATTVSSPVPSPPATVSPSFLCSMAADLGISMLLRHVLSLGASVANSQWEHCGFNHRAVVSPLRPRAACPCDHAPYAFARLNRPLADCTFRDLVVAAGFTSASAWDALSVAIDELHWIEKGCCQCSALRVIRRFRRGDRGASARCRQCRQPVIAQPFFSHRAVPVPLVRELFDKPLRVLGAADARWALVRAGDRTTFLHHPDLDGA